MPNDPPPNDVVEVSVFGPGVGESIVIHLGNQDWMIVDSCRDSSGSIPELAYLRRIGVSPPEAVRLVVGTHAHDDHFAGLAEVLDECRTAYFVCSAAGVKEEYLALLGIEQRISATGRRRAIEEYGEIHRIIQQRGRDDRGNKHLRYAIENSVLFERPRGENGAVSVRAISPSHEAITRARTALAQQFPIPGQQVRSRPIDPNILAIALWIDVAGTSILLGADLLVGPTGCGWKAAVSNFRTDQRAGIVKIPHHGSPTSHHDEAWERFLIESPISVVAPYRAGVRPRPSETDAKRIIRMSGAAYVTSTPGRVAMTRAAKAETARLGPLAQNVRQLSGIAGQVRARAVIGTSKWDVDLVRPARELSEVQLRD